MLLPCLLFQESPLMNLTIKGGTMVSNSPSLHPYRHVLFPALNKMGITAEYEMKWHGLFPDVMGEIQMKI